MTDNSIMHEEFLFIQNEFNKYYKIRQSIREKTQKKRSTRSTTSKYSSTENTDLSRPSQKMILNCVYNMKCLRVPDDVIPRAPPIYLL